MDSPADLQKMSENPPTGENPQNGNGEVSKPLYVLHVVILFWIISIPLWPIKYLQYGVYIPTIITLLWLLTGACPLTDADPALDHFTHHFVSNFIDGVQVETVDNALIFTMVLVTLLGARKLFTSQCKAQSLTP